MNRTLAISVGAILLFAVVWYVAGRHAAPQPPAPPACAHVTCYRANPGALVCTDTALTACTPVSVGAVVGAMQCNADLTNCVPVVAAGSATPIVILTSDPMKGLPLYANVTSGVWRTLR